MSLVLQSSGGGSITVQEPATASNFTQTLPAATGTVMVSGNQPTFRAFLPSNQTLSNATDTKITLTNEVFDTASCFNNTGSTVNGIPAYAFLPNVAGYYQINAIVGGSASVSLVYNWIQIRRSSTEDSRAIYAPYGANSYGSVSNLIFLNGSTDYVELFVQLAGTGTLNALATYTMMSGVLVRAA